MSARGPSHKLEQTMPQPPAAAGSTAYVTHDEQYERLQPPAVPGFATRHSESYPGHPQPPAAPIPVPHDPNCDLRYEHLQPPAAPGSLHTYIHALGAAAATCGTGLEQRALPSAAHRPKGRFTRAHEAPMTMPAQHLRSFSWGPPSEAAAGSSTRGASAAQIIRRK